MPIAPLPAPQSRARLRRIGNCGIRLIAQCNASNAEQRPYCWNFHNPCELHLMRLVIHLQMTAVEKYRCFVFQVFQGGLV